MAPNIREEVCSKPLLTLKLRLLENSYSVQGDVASLVRALSGSNTIRTPVIRTDVLVERHRTRLTPRRQNRDTSVGALCKSVEGRCCIFFVGADGLRALSCLGLSEAAVRTRVQAMPDVYSVLEVEHDRGSGHISQVIKELSSRWMPHLSPPEQPFCNFTDRTGAQLVRRSMGKILG